MNSSTPWRNPDTLCSRSLRKKTGIDRVFGLLRRIWIRRSVDRIGTERSSMRISGFLRRVSASALLPSATSMISSPFSRRYVDNACRDMSEGSAIRTRFVPGDVAT